MTSRNLRGRCNPRIHLGGVLLTPKDSTFVVNICARLAQILACVRGRDTRDTCQPVTHRFDQQIRGDFTVCRRVCHPLYLTMGHSARLTHEPEANRGSIAFGSQQTRPGPTDGRRLAGSRCRPRRPLIQIGRAGRQQARYGLWRAPRRAHDADGQAPPPGPPRMRLRAPRRPDGPPAATPRTEAPRQAWRTPPLA